MVEQKPWLKHYPPEIPASIQSDEKPLHQFLLDSDKNLKLRKGNNKMVNQKPWLKNNQQKIPASKHYDKKPLHQFWLNSEQNFGDLKAVHFMGKQFSFNQIVSDARKLAHFFKKKV